MTDKFPEAFKRFEEQADMDNIDSFTQLLREFRDWAKIRWTGTDLQRSALMTESDKLGLTNWKTETIKRAGKEYVIHRSIKTGRFVKIRK